MSDSARAPDAVPPAFPGLPPEADAVFRRLLEEPDRSLDEICAELDAYIARVRVAAEHDEQVELGLAEALHTRSRSFIKRAEGSTPAQRRVIQAAVRYFILDEDASGDLESPVGFDDDVGVMNAVARWLGHADLVIDLD